MLEFVYKLLQLQYDFVSSVRKVYWFLFSSMLISVIIYALFFTFYLPPAQHIKPIHFLFDHLCDRDDARLCSYPEANVSLHNYHKPTNKAVRVLTRGQEYEICVQLELPFSEQNRNIGMFLSKIDILSKDKKVLDSSSRASLLEYESGLVWTIKTLVYFIPLLLGLQNERRWTEVVLLDSFTDSSYEPAEIAKITIYSKQIQFYSARLKITAKFSGIRYYMHAWPLTFSAIAFSNILLVVILVFLYRSADDDDVIHDDIISDSDYDELADVDGDRSNDDLIMLRNDNNVAGDNNDCVDNLGADDTADNLMRRRPVVTVGASSFE